MKTMTKPAILTVCVFLFSFAAFSQSQNFVSELLESPKANYGEACYLSAVYQGLADENAGAERAFQILQDAGQVKNDVKASDEISYSAFCALAAKSWKINGSLLFRASKGAGRYAFRQFKADKVIVNDVDPGAIISGSDMLTIYTLCEKKYGVE